jgi:hypothetical protein
MNGYRVAEKCKRSHFFRHNFATRFLKKKILEGADAHVVAAFLQQYMGCAKIESTMYYVHFMTELRLLGKVVSTASFWSTSPRPQLSRGLIGIWLGERSVAWE